MEMEKEANNSACLEWDFRLETPGEALAAIKHSIRRERQFPECGSRGGREKHPCGNPDPIPAWNGLVGWLLLRGGCQEFSGVQTLV